MRTPKLSFNQPGKRLLLPSAGQRKVSYVDRWWARRKRAFAHRTLRLHAGLGPQKFTRFEIAPSTTRFEPVVKEEAGLARNTAALAISCGVAMRPVGLRASASW